MTNPETTTINIVVADPPVLLFKGCGKLYIVKTGFVEIRDAAGALVPQLSSSPGQIEFRADGELYASAPSGPFGNPPQPVSVTRWF